MPTGIYLHKPRSEEAKRKISKTLTGKPRLWLRGRSLSEEHKYKIGLANKGKHNSPHLEATKIKIGLANKGKHSFPCLEKTKIKIRKALIGRKISEEHKRRLIEANTGRSCSEETKKKLSLANKGSRSPNWQGGITQETKKRIASYE